MCTSRSGIPVPPFYRNFGYTTTAEISHACKQWAEAHQLTLFIVGTVLAELRGGGAYAVLSAPQSVVFDEAENRLHAQKGVLAWALGAVR